MASYTHGHHESVLRSHLWRTVENSAAYLCPHLEPGMSLLDVGCGPGNLTVDLARLVAPGRVVGIDNVDSIIQRAVSDTPEDSGSVEFVVDYSPLRQNISAGRLSTRNTPLNQGVAIRLYARILAIYHKCYATFLQFVTPFSIYIRNVL